MVLALVLLALLGFSLLLNLGHVLGRLSGQHGKFDMSAGPRLEEVVRETAPGSAKIAVVEVSGIITGEATEGGYSMVEVIRAQLKRAEEDANVRAVILKVDSPGGEVLASDEIYNEITDFQERTDKPVIASMGNLAASGGYYVSAPCRWIVANELTITGSIGVIMQTWNYRQLMDKVGVAPQVYKSGKFKDMLSGSRQPAEIPEEEAAMMKGLIDEVYTKFKEAVALGRESSRAANSSQKQKGRPLASDWAEYADGRVFSGSEALRLGFVDELGNFEDAVIRATKIAGIQDATLVEYQQHYNLADFLRIFSKTEVPAVKVNLGIQAPKIQAGRLYYIAPSFAY